MRRQKTTDDTRQEKLKTSLPYLDDEQEPVFPRVKVKENHMHWYYLALILFVMIIIGFYSQFMIAKVSGSSMDNTLHNGQIMLVHRHEKVKRFDIVVLNERLKKDGPSKKIIKRVIGFPGDTVTVLDGNLYINSQRYEENYLADNHITNFRNVNWTIKVPKDHLFVLGDNRDVSKDSRTVGSFKTSAVVGVAIVNKGEK